MVLLLYFVDDGGLGPDLLDGAQQDVGGDGDEEQGVEEDEHDEEQVHPHADVDGYQLVVRVRVEGGQHVHDEDGPAQCPVVLRELVVGRIRRDLDELVRHDREGDDDEDVENGIHEDIDVGGHDGNEDLPDLLVIHDRQHCY